MLRKFLTSPKFYKKALCILLIVGFFAFAAVHAQSVQSTAGGGILDGIKAGEFVSIADLLLKAVYLLMRPLLVIAGLALDNSLVYASFFHMDAPLREFWNMTKNFANFALGFAVLFSIIRSIFAFGKDDSKWKPQKIIISALIAGVLIQLSRFLMAVLIDLSTIATYAIGGLPLNVIGSTNLGNHRILQTHAKLNFDALIPETGTAQSDALSARYSTKSDFGTLYFANCTYKDKYVVGRQDGDKKFTLPASVFGEGTNACVRGGKLIVFNEFTPLTTAQDDAIYQDKLTKILDLEEWESLEACQYIVNPFGKSTDKTCGSVDRAALQSEYIDANAGEDATFLHAPASYSFNAQTGGDARLQNNELAMSLGTLIDKSKGFVGPLITMYSSLLNFTNTASLETDTSFGVLTGETLIKIGFAIGLFFPLIALAVVLIMRVGYLRALIVASPFVVLINVFKWGDKLEKLKDFVSIESIMRVIFAPVFTVFALSISLVFISVLSESLHTGEAMPDVKAGTNNENNSQIFKTLEDCLELKLENFNLGGALDGFSWFLINIMAIGLMRAVVFAAIKAGKVGEKIGGQIQTFGQNIFQTLPILPIGGGERGVGIESAAKVLGAVPERYVTELERTQTEKVEKWIGTPGMGGETKTVTPAEAGTMVTEIAAKPAEVEAIITKATGAATAAEIATPENIAVFAAAVGKLGETEAAKAETAAKALANITGFGANRREKYDLDNALKDKTTLKDANDALPTIKAAILTPLDKAYTKELKDGTETKTYALTKDAATGTFSFIPPAAAATPQGGT